MRGTGVHGVVRHELNSKPHSHSRFLLSRPHCTACLQDVPLLTIGRHTLHGQRVPLSKPMALMRKAAQPASEAESKPLAAYDVVAVVRHKLLFDTRPVTKMLA